MRERAFRGTFSGRAAKEQCWSHAAHPTSARRLRKACEAGCPPGRQAPPRTRLILCHVQGPPEPGPAQPVTRTLSVSCRKA